MNIKHKIIVVTPVYEDITASSKLFSELYRLHGQDVFVVAVDDGSVHQPLEIECLVDARIDGIILRLRRNVGHQSAIATGLEFVSRYVQADMEEGLRPDPYVVVMDSDGEDLPASIQQLLEALEDENTDVVVASRNSRVESFGFKAFYFLYKRVFKVLTGREISFGNFMAMKMDSLGRLVAMPELSTHVASSVIASKLRTNLSLIDRGPRYAGESKMNFVSLALHGFKGVMIFTENVLVRLGVACAVVSAICVISAIAVVILKFSGITLPGWSSIILGLLMLIFLQTGTLTLLMLLLTGIAKNTAPLAAPERVDIIREIIGTSLPYMVSKE